MLTILGNIWTLGLLLLGLTTMFVCAFTLGIMYTQMEEDEYENGKFMDKMLMKIGKKIINFWY